MCEYCDSKHKEFKVNTNIKDDRVFAIIAKGDKQHEIVLNTKNGVFGIEISKCPNCGRDLN